MSISKIKEKSLTSDAVTESNLDITAFTGQTELSETANDSDVLLIYDASAGSLKKVLRSNLVLQAPTFSSISPTNVNTGDGTGNATFTITGANFSEGTTARLFTTGGTEVAFDSVTRDSTTQLTCVIAISSLSNANEPYGVQVLGGNGVNTAVQSGQVNINAQPVFTTTAGSLGSNRFSMSGISVNATDPESAGNVTFELQSGSLPPGISIVNTAAEGGTATFSGTISPLASSDTVYSFTLRAVDAASNTNSRAFSFTASGPISESFTSSGTFAVPTGVTSADVLVVAGGGSGGSHHGGGGGGGGLVFMPSVPVSPGGTIAITVGCGGPAPANFPGTPSGASGSTGQDSIFGASPSPGTTNPLTAKGGGGGGFNDCGVGGPGGSGGGGSAVGNSLRGPGIQPTQPGNSGAYGFGNDGGDGVIDGPKYLGGGGGGAGAAGPPGLSPVPSGGPGAVGRSYTIADGTTPVGYAGGGGGGAHIHAAGAASPCGSGGKGSFENDTSPLADKSGQANKGGGGGGADRGPGDRGSGGAGGKGIVIVRY